MSKKQSTGKAYIKALRSLRESLKGDYAGEGWLPPGREMAERLGVSYMTYCKALNQITREGWVKSYPKKGHKIIPAPLRTRKIGLIFESGETSPFIGECENIAAILTVLSRHFFHAQIIQGASFDQLYEAAHANGLEGLIWFDPPSKAAPEIEAIDTNGEFPLVVVQLHDFTPSCIMGRGCVGYAHLKTLQEHARLIHSRGHDSAAYIGISYDTAMDRGTIEAFKSRGVTIPPELCIATPENCPGELATQLEALKVKVLFSQGGAYLASQVLTELSTMPEESRPEVLVAHFPTLPALYRLFPDITPMPLPEYGKKDIGEVAAKMLLDHILMGKILSHKASWVTYTL